MIIPTCVDQTLLFIRDFGVPKPEPTFYICQIFSYQRSSRGDANESFLAILTCFTPSFEFLLSQPCNVSIIVLFQLQLSHECTHDCNTSVFFLYFPSSVMHLFWENFTRPCHSVSKDTSPTPPSGSRAIKSHWFLFNPKLSFLTLPSCPRSLS